MTPDRCCHDVYECFNPVFWVEGVRWWLMVLQCFRCIYCGYQQVYNSDLKKAAPLRSEEATAWINAEKEAHFLREREFAK